MALDQFIPSIWASRILEGLEKQLIFGQPAVIGRDYQGEIRAYGDTVHVHSFSDLTIGDYQKNVTTLNYELLSDARVTLVIDRSKYFAFRVDDVDAAQMHPKIINQASGRAAYQLAELADRHIASQFAEAAPANVTVASAFDSSNVYAKFVELSVAMDEGNVPDEGRFAIVPPAVVGLMLQNPQLLGAKTDAPLNGEIGSVAGIRILKSNNVPVTSGTPDVHHVVAGVAEAWTHAEQIASVEALRLEGSFSDAVRGLHLYGSKVLQPELLFDLQATV